MMKVKGMKAMTLAGMLAAGMSMSTSVWAVPLVGSGTEENPAGAEITKNLEIADGITVPETDFTFEFKKVTADAPDIAVQTIKYTNKDTALNNIVEKTTENIFAGITFPHAGEFVYTLKETEGLLDIESGKMKYDESEYTIRVFVKNGENGPYISDITAEKNGSKQSCIDFLNTFRKDTSLTVSKKTEGDMADKTKLFNFVITFEKSATCEEDSFTSGGITYEYGKEYSFELADGDSKTFEIPAGTRYEVVEQGAEDGYTPQVSVVENGGTATSISAEKDKDSLSSAQTNGGEKNLAGEKENKVEFINTYKEVPITGVLMNNFPFIFMVLTAIAGFAGCVFGRRHRMAR